MTTFDNGLTTYDDSRASTSKINVLHVIWSLEKGGAERFLVSLVKNFDRNLFNSIVCCLNWKGEWAKELEEKGIKVIALNKRGKFDIFVIFKIITVIKQNKIDIVSTHLWAADVFGRLAAILAKTPIIVSTVHRVELEKKWWQWKLEKLLGNRTDIFIAVANAVKNHYHQQSGVPLSKIAYIPNSIELEKFKIQGDITYLHKELNLTSQNFILLCLGRLSKEKGHKYLFEALSLLNGQYRFKLLVVGEGPLRNSLQSMVHSLQLDDKVIFTGQRNDIPQILEISDCLVLPSLYEGLPTCILEAMAMSKPVIATTVGGTQELIKNGEAGFIVEPRNPTALSEAITKLIKMPDRERRELGLKGREIVINNFSIENIAKETENVFLELVEKNIKK